jgi:hypothetical protein
MNNMKKILILLIAVLTGIFSASAQSDGLTKEIENTLKEQAMVKVNELTDHISFLMKKSGYDNTVKEYHLRAALNLFVGGGRAYTDKWGNQQRAAHMQASRINRATSAVSIKEYPVSTYLSNLKYLDYDEIIITNSNSTCIGDVYKTGDGEYEAVLSWVQIFVGKKGDMTVYRDKTKKDIVVKMTRNEYDDGIVRWSVLLGDTTAAVTE